MRETSIDHGRPWRRQREQRRVAKRRETAARRTVLGWVVVPQPMPHNWSQPTARERWVARRWRGRDWGTAQERGEKKGKDIVLRLISSIARSGRSISVTENCSRAFLQNEQSNENHLAILRGYLLGQ
jgi:hypothetical protein